MAVVLITHDLALVAEEADRVAVMYAGNIVETGSVAEVFADPKHPYTKGLLDSVPVNAVRGDELKSIGGSPPDLHSIPEGCVYQARCPLAREICRTTRPDARHRRRQAEVRMPLSRRRSPMSEQNAADGSAAVRPRPVQVVPGARRRAGKQAARARRHRPRPGPR